MIASIGEGAIVKSSMSNQSIATGTKEVNPHCPNSLECSRADTYLWVQLISPNFPQQQVALKFLSHSSLFLKMTNACLNARLVPSQLPLKSEHIYFSISCFTFQAAALEVAATLCFKESVSEDFSSGRKRRRGQLPKIRARIQPGMPPANNMPN